MTEKIISFVMPHFYFNPAGLLNLGASLISFSVGLIVLSKNFRSRVHRSFSLINITGAIWLFCYARVYSSFTVEQAYLWLKFGFIFGVPFLSITVYVFSQAWTNRPTNTLFIKTGLAFCALFGIFVTLFIESIFTIKPHFYGLNSNYNRGPLGTTFFWCILSHFIVYGIGALLTIFKAYRKASSPMEKVQFRNFLAGAVVGYMGTIDFFTARSLEFYPIGLFTYTIFSLTIAYTIIKHQFLNVNLLIKKLSLVVLIYVSLFAVLIPITIPLAKRMASNQLHNPELFIFLSILFISSYLSLGPFIYAYLIQQTFWLKGNISKGLTHELKSPLSSIEGAAEFLIDQADTIPRQKLKEYLGLIRNNSVRLNKLTGDLLSLIKINDGDLTLSKEKLDISDLIGIEIRRYKPILEKREIEIKTEVPEGIQVFGDIEKIRQVISNLLSNAIKFSGNGKVTLNLKKEPKNLVFSISDTGEGIDQKNLNKIFNRFFQSKKTAKGAGIGLTIAKGWIEAHGGKIWAESEGVGRGAKVSFILPSQLC